jgi:hypothetical protein
LRDTWHGAGDTLDMMLNERVSGLYTRMWLHLGTALFLLSCILGMVYMVAQQIRFPLRRLSQVVDTVGRTGDHSLRAEWSSQDEIGRLVTASTACWRSWTAPARSSRNWPPVRGRPTPSRPCWRPRPSPSW